MPLAISSVCTRMHCMPACIHVCVSVFVLAAHTQPDPPTHKKKRKGKIANAMTTQSSNVNLVELLLSTVQRGPCSLPFPTVTSSSTSSSVNFSEHRPVCYRTLIAYRSGVYWKLCSCSSWSLDHGYSMFTSSVLLGDET